MQTVPKKSLSTETLNKIEHFVESGKKSISELASITAESLTKITPKKSEINTLLQIGNHSGHCKTAKINFLKDLFQNKKIDLKKHQETIIYSHIADQLETTPEALIKTIKYYALGKSTAKTDLNSNQKALVSKILELKKSGQLKGFNINIVGSCDATSHKLVHPLDWHQAKVQKLQELTTLIAAKRIKPSKVFNKLKQKLIEKYYKVVSTKDDKKIKKFLSKYHRHFLSSKGIFNLTLAFERAQDYQEIQDDQVFILKIAHKRLSEKDRLSALKITYTAPTTTAKKLKEQAKQTSTTLTTTVTPRTADTTTNSNPRRTPATTYIPYPAPRLAAQDALKNPRRHIDTTTHPKAKIAPKSTPPTPPTPRTADTNTNSNPRRTPATTYIPYPAPRPATQHDKKYPRLPLDTTTPAYPRPATEPAKRARNKIDTSPKPTTPPSPKPQPPQSARAPTTQPDKPKETNEVLDPTKINFGQNLLRSRKIALSSLPEDKVYFMDRHGNIIDHPFSTKGILDKDGTTIPLFKNRKYNQKYYNKAREILKAKTKYKNIFFADQLNAEHPRAISPRFKDKSGTLEISKQNSQIDYPTKKLHPLLSTKTLSKEFSTLSENFSKELDKEIPKGLLKKTSQKLVETLTENPHKLSKKRAKKLVKAISDEFPKFLKALAREFPEASTVVVTIDKELVGMLSEKTINLKPEVAKKLAKKIAKKLAIIIDKEFRTLLEKNATESSKLLKLLRAKAKTYPELSEIDFTQPQSKLRIAQQIFAQSQIIPKELKDVIVHGLPAVESGFEHKRSPDGALSAWQIMPSTAEDLRKGGFIPKEFEDHYDDSYTIATIVAKRHFEKKIIGKLKDKIKDLMNTLDFQGDREDFANAVYLTAYNTGQNRMPKVLNWFKKRQLTNKKIDPKKLQKMHSLDLFAIMIYSYASYGADQNFGTDGLNYAIKVKAMAEVMTGKTTPYKIDYTTPANDNDYYQELFQDYAELIKERAYRSGEIIKTTELRDGYGFEPKSAKPKGKKIATLKPKTKFNIRRKHNRPRRVEEFETLECPENVWIEIEITTSPNQDQVGKTGWILTHMGDTKYMQGSNKVIEDDSKEKSP